MAVKVAILGYGRSGSTLHADPIEKLGEFAMTAVCDIDPEARDKAYRRFGCRIYENYHEMLNKEELDLVVIVTRSSQHCKMTCDCLRAGKNVLVTKPWAVNPEEAMEMIKAAKDSGKLLLPWLPARWGCDLLRLKEIIASGTIGKVFQVRRSEYNFGVRNDWQTLKQYGGGYLLNWGPHLVDQPMQLLGTRVKSVYAHMKQIINPGDAEDVFFAVMKMEDGVTVVSEYNIGPDDVPNWVVQGDRGYITVKEKHIKIYKSGLPEKIDGKSYGVKPEIHISEEDIDGTNSISMGNRYGDSMVIYPIIAQAVTGKRPYDISTDSALYLSRVLHAIRESAETDEAIHIQEAIHI